MTAVTSREQGPVTCGELLRSWRHRRRLSQLDLALAVGVSARHVSFLETGRSLPSRRMILLLSDHLTVPIRDQNQILAAAGFAPVHAERSLDAPQMRAVRETLQILLMGQEPYPAVVLDRWWNMVDANPALQMMVSGVAEHLLTPPVNVLRLSLHPDGLAPRIVNLGEWRAHLLHRLARQVSLTGDGESQELLTELQGYPGPPRGGGPDGDPNDGPVGGTADDDAVVVPLRLLHGDRELALMSTVTTFGTPLDVTVAELFVESFYPANDATASFLRSR